ncbi:LacI family DNA-binding transcriptional regulator [Dactylosporangium matsuzakiense]|uniref:LacI family DNA-binding transcriptional regulator n=1 Tax=Dactylosporangium matsuzakiense TaxID=53360 RepID=UPI0021C3C1B1|nr:LacI family DNA-binding transcriptional regulator [Dactylosporangium matsuzakiense]UWZ48757.1 LacI family DNA-binding transcriptional regulator [Dactylosporangium matsuzakiense]
MGASLKDVAQRAGVSIRTVSNVVNDFPLVAPGTRERVRRAIEELQYRPNAAARTLRGGRSGLIGLVLPELASPYFGELAALVTEAAERRAWTVLVEQSGGDADRERRLLDGGRTPGGQAVDGLLLSPWSLGAADLRARPAGGPPVVLLGEQDADGLFDHVAIDNVTAAAAATHHLLATGRRRIAAIGLQPHLANGTAEQRHRGYRTALAEAGIRPDPALELEVDRLHRPDGAAALRRLVEETRRFDALFCFTDQLALGAMRALYQLGGRVPDDVAVVGFDDIEDGRFSTPSLTTIAPDKAAIAEAALDCLATRLTPAGAVPSSGTPAAANPGRSIVIPHQLVVRESTATRTHH